MRTATIGALMLVVAWLGVGFAAVRTPTTPMVNLVFYLSVAILSVASYRARRPGANWWFGLALFGWFNLLMGFVAMSARQVYGVGIIIPVDLVWGTLWFAVPDDGTDPGAIFGSYYVFTSVFSVIFGAIMATLIALVSAATRRWRRRRDGTKPISGTNPAPAPAAPNEANVRPGSA